MSNKKQPAETLQPKTSRSGDLMIKIFCVVAAFCMWIYVMQTESPESETVFENVVVQIEPESYSLSSKGTTILDGYGQQVTITLSGPRRILSGLDAETIVAKADLSGIQSDGSKYPCKVIVDVPDDCKLIGVSPEYITVNSDIQGEKNVDIGERMYNTRLPADCYTEPTEFSVEKIKVAGPQTLLSNVERAMVEIDMAGVQSTVKMTAAVYLVNKYGERIDNPALKITPAEVTLTVPVTKSVTVPLEVDFVHDFFHEENTRITLDPATVVVTGEPAIIDRGDLIEPIVINEKTDFEQMLYNRRLSIEAVPNVRVTDSIGSPISLSFVDVTVEVDESIKTREITVPGSNIKDTGGKTGVHYTWKDDPITVTLIGTVEALAGVSPEDITVKLDMSPYDGSNSGESRVRAEIDIDSEYADDVLELGIYSVLVTFE